MDIKISKKIDAGLDEGFSIHVESMTSSEFDAVRILLKSFVERFSSVKESQLDLSHVVSLIGSLKE